MSGSSKSGSIIASIVVIMAIKICGPAYDAAFAPKLPVPAVQGIDYAELISRNDSGRATPPLSDAWKQAARKSQARNSKTSDPK